jgi:hypothetical protein
LVYTLLESYLFDISLFYYFKVFVVLASSSNSIREAHTASEFVGRLLTIKEGIKIAQNTHSHCGTGFFRSAAEMRQQD